MTGLAALTLLLASGADCPDKDVRCQFVLGYTHRAAAEPELMALLPRMYGVIGCESRWVVDPPGPHLGLAQFAGPTWLVAGRSPDADWRSAWEQGWAVAQYLAIIGPENAGTSAGWRSCWGRN